MEKGPEDAPEGSAGDAGGEELSAEDAVEKQIYLRTVYPLNPGIPHFVDVPGGW